MSDLAKNMSASFDEWLQKHPLKPLLHSQIVKQVEEMMATIARLEGRECYQQALSDTADRLHDVARWCKENGFDARARHTDSAARRVKEDQSCQQTRSQEPSSSSSSSGSPSPDASSPSVEEASPSSGVGDVIMKLHKEADDLSERAKAECIRKGWMTDLAKQWNHESLGFSRAADVVERWLRTVPPAWPFTSDPARKP